MPTYHNDNARDGVNPNEIALSPATFPTPTTANFGLLTPTGATGAVDSLIYAQPLYLSGVAMNTTSCTGSSTNLVLVATENNSVYAFTYTYSTNTNGYTFALTQCWMLPLNQTGEYAIPFTALPQNGSGIPCNNVVPQSGITGTPVVDTSVTPPIMYVVTADRTATLGYTYRIHAIYINTGKEVKSGTAAPYDLSGIFPTGISPWQQNQRPGLALFRASTGPSHLYVAFGSFCDLHPYTGLVAGLTFTYGSRGGGFALTGVFDTQHGQTTQDGGIWMGGAAPAVDTAGNVYVAVGNGSWDGSSYFGESAVKIVSTSSAMVAVDYYTPNDYLDLESDLNSATLCSTYNNLANCPSTNQLVLPAGSGDYDLGSGGITLIKPIGSGITSPACGSSNSELITGGKEGVGYGICYSTQTGSTLENVMGGLDGCGYGCSSTTVNPSLTACSQPAAGTVPTPGYIAQCFQGVNAGENVGTNTIFQSSGIRGTEAFWAGPSVTPQNRLYVAGVATQMSAYVATTPNGLFNPTPAVESNPHAYPYPGAVPAVSWNANATTNPQNTALLWALDVGGYGLWNSETSKSKAASPAILYVYNAIPDSAHNTLTELWNSAASGPGAVKFTVPTVAGGLVFVGGGTAGYAPGLPGGTNVNCTAAALVNSQTSVICGGMLSVYGELHQ